MVPVLPETEIKDTVGGDLIVKPDDAPAGTKIDLRGAVAGEAGDPVELSDVT